MQIETINLIPWHVALDKVDYWFQDEARIGQQNTTTRLWAPKGSRPRAVKQQQFESAGHPMLICLVQSVRVLDERRQFGVNFSSDRTRPSCGGDNGWSMNLEESPPTQLHYSCIQAS